MPLKSGDNGESHLTMRILVAAFDDCLYSGHPILLFMRKSGGLTSVSPVVLKGSDVR